MNRYFIVYKPYKMISQFVSPYPEQRLLGALDFDFPAGTQAVGRLDNDSEGLLLLTNDKTIVRRLLHPDKLHKRHYYVYVKHRPSAEAITVLRQGVGIRVKKKGDYFTKSCDVSVLDMPPLLPERVPPVEEHVPHTWLSFALTEGKNRQIRKMCRAVRHECRRLVRVSIENINIEGMQPGEVREMPAEEFLHRLNLQ